MSKEKCKKLNETLLSNKKKPNEIFKFACLKDFPDNCKYYKLIGLKYYCFKDSNVGSCFLDQELEDAEKAKETNYPSSMSFFMQRG